MRKVDATGRQEWGNKGNRIDAYVNALGLCHNIARRSPLLESLL